ncbi:hypothetical protein ACLNGM_06420 [Aureimonas phyllosphaerae]|uniref:hypothetical protein n=1 Tax=Aureimonas phyllosphaerae TaxID=1166078 RepID=UPI003A5C66CD
MGSIRANRRFYNNPEIGQAFDNLAAAFAPPSGADAAGWARANAKREQAARLAKMFDYANDPNYDQTRADRLGVLGGLYAPTQSFYAVDKADDTTRRGQDVLAASSRYGSDRTYAASTENNVRDNARVVQTNEADNVRALEDRRLQEAGALQRLYAEPVKVGQGERAYLPAQAAAAMSLPEQLNGADKPMSTDEVAAMAMQAMPLGDRQQFVRDKFAPTETQVQGQERRDLRDRGILTDDDLVADVLSAMPVEEVVGAGGRPEFVRRQDAVGRQPAPKQPMVSVSTGEAPDGKLRGKLDESEGKRLSDLQATAVTSSGLRQDLDLMDQLIEQAPQGPLVGRLAAVLPGFSDASAAFQSVVERAAPGLRVEGSGATSDIEFRGMLNSLPQLRNRPEANRLIAGMMRAKADINIRRGDLVTAYQNGDIDASQMRRQLADLNRQSIASPALRDMIDAVGGGVEPMSGAKPTTDAPSPGSIVDGHRFRGGDPADPANWELL